MDELDHDLLISCTAGLGSTLDDEEGYPVYCKTDDCVACLKDLQRFMREDDEIARPAFFALCATNVAKTDLVPLLYSYPDDHDIVFNAVKVATFLTLPQPDNVDSHDKDKQVECMQSVMEAFLSEDALATVVNLLTEPLSNKGTMSEKEAQLVQLIFTFLRNLLKIPNRSKTAGCRGDHKSKLKNNLLRYMFDIHFTELLLQVAQHSSQGRLKDHAPLLLEVLALILNGVKVQEILHAELPSTSLGHKSRTARLTSSLPEAKNSLDSAYKKLNAVSLPQRHPRFGGIFTSGSAASKISITRNVPDKTSLPSLNSANRLKKKLATTAEEEPPNRMECMLMIEMTEFLDDLMGGAYTVLMKVIGKLLEPGLGVSRLTKADFVAFTEVAAVCTAYVRIREEEKLRLKRKEAARQNLPEPLSEEIDSPFACISATMNWDAFHMVQNLCIANAEVPSNTPGKDWKLQQNSLILLKEMLLALDVAKQAGTHDDKAAATSIAKRLLHDDQEDSGVFNVLAKALKDYDFTRQPRSHAETVVEAIHITLRLLQQLSQKGGEKFIVQRAAKTRRSKQRQRKPQDGMQNPVNDHTAGEDGAQSGNELDAPPAWGRESTFEDLEEEMAASREVIYNLNEQLRTKMAFPAIIHLYTWLLQDYSTNSRFLNHAIVSFFQRIASPDVLDLECMLYQLSVMRVFERILADKEFRKQPHAHELIQFCTRITRNLFSRLILAPQQSATKKTSPKNSLEGGEDEAEASEAEQPLSPTAERQQAREQEIQKNLVAMMFVELLFWKPAKLAEEISNGYNWKWKLGEEDAGAGISKAHEEELRELFEELGREGNYVELIAQQHSGGYPQDKIRRCLGHLGLKRGVLTDNQAEKLRELYEINKGSRSCVREIAMEMPGNWNPGQIRTQLQKLGLLGTKKAPKLSSQINASQSDRESNHSEKSGQSADDGIADGQNEGGGPQAEKKIMQLKSRHINKKHKGMADWSDDESDIEVDIVDIPANNGSQNDVPLPPEPAQQVASHSRDQQTKSQSPQQSPQSESPERKVSEDDEVDSQKPFSEQGDIEMSNPPDAGEASTESTRNDSGDEEASGGSPERGGQKRDLQQRDGTASREASPEKIRSTEHADAEDNSPASVEHRQANAIKRKRLLKTAKPAEMDELGDLEDL